LKANRFQGFVFSPADLAEDVELDADRRREILLADGTLATATHWDVLGLPWNAPAAAAKAAYVEKVKIFHPDRYAGRRLGSFRGRLERVFARLTEARDVLVDERRREAYARSTAPAPELAKLELRKLEDERRSGERRARLARQNPILARASRMGELVTRGKQAFSEGRFVQAANDLQLALGLDPANGEVAALAADARRKAAAQRSAELYDKGVAAEVLGRLGAALEAYRAAAEADAANVRAASAAARLSVERGDLREARGHAEAALKAGPRAGVAHEAMGLVLDAEGAKRDAKKALERAVELDPRLESAKERLKKLRWSFLG
jgi:tetratricopeptide (TPR) repeat protein